MLQGLPVGRKLRDSLFGVAALFASALMVPVASAAVTLDAAVSDVVAGSTQSPAGVVFHAFVDLDAQEPSPTAVRITLGQGLALNATPDACEPGTVRARPGECPGGSVVGGGQLATPENDYPYTLYVSSAGGMVARYVTDAGEGEVTPVTVDSGTRSLTFAVPSVVGAKGLRSLDLRLGEPSPATDWVKSTQCPGGAWRLQADLLDAAGAVQSGASMGLGCRPPRRAGLGRIAPQLRLFAEIRNGRKIVSLKGVTLGPGFPADSVIHVVCRAGCRGRWRQRVNRSGPTPVNVSGRVRVANPALRIEVSVASRSLRGSYLVLAFRRAGDGRILGWNSVARGCLRLGDQPTRVSCLR